MKKTSQGVIKRRLANIYNFKKKKKQNQFERIKYKGTKISEVIIKYKSINVANVAAKQLYESIILCRLIYPGYIAFYTCCNCISQDKNLTALTELSAITAAFVSMT